MKCVRIVSLMVFCLLLVSKGAFAQDDFRTDSRKAKKLLEEAIMFYNLQRNEQAGQLAMAALGEDSNFVNAWMLLGEMNMEDLKYDAAKAHFQRALAIEPSDFYSNYFNLGRVNMKLEEYDAALANFTDFLENPELDSRAERLGKRMVETASYRKRMVESPVAFDPENLGATINSSFWEHSPTLTADQATIYFTRNRPKGQRNRLDEDFYISTRDEAGNWQQAQNLGTKINTQFNEGASCISADGRYLFFTSCERPQGVGSCDLYLARKQGDDWVEPINLGNIINSYSWDSQPSFSADGRTLYFTSNRRGGKGGKDIWMTRVGDDGQWTKPTSLPFNTKGDDQSPFIHPNGYRFYFSSDGRMGMGMSDLFYVDQLADGTWGEPVNLGYPINTAGSEVSLIVSADGNTGYYATDKPGGSGKWDLYAFELPESVKAKPVAYTKGVVINKKTGEPIGAAFEIIDLETGRKVIEATSDPINGEFLVIIPTGKQYALNVSKTGYLFHSGSFYVQSYHESNEVNVALNPIEVGKKVVLENIFFETGSYALKPTSKAELDKLVAFLNQNKELRIEIGGHTDNVGGVAMNQELSSNRAESVANYLVDQGVASHRLTSKGYNFSEPIASNDTEAGRAKNRRTEFKVIE